MRHERRILVVDDEPSIVQFLKMGLEAEGFSVSTASDGLAAVALARATNPHVVVLDLMMPGLNGHEVCAELRRSVRTAIIMLTARDSIDDKIRGLELGADDYMVKPFSFRELLARINARLRAVDENETGSADLTSVGEFVLDAAAHEIRLRGSALELSPTEYNLLNYLLTNDGRALSKQQILDQVWGYDFCGDENVVEVYIGYLRQKLGDSTRQLIRTVRSVGYKAVVR